MVNKFFVFIAAGSALSFNPSALSAEAAPKWTPATSIQRLAVSEITQEHSENDCADFGLSEDSTMTIVNLDTMILLRIDGTPTTWRYSEVKSKKGLYHFGHGSTLGDSDYYSYALDLEKSELSLHQTVSIMRGLNDRDIKASTCTVRFSNLEKRNRLSSGSRITR